MISNRATPNVDVGPYAAAPRIPALSGRIRFENRARTAMVQRGGGVDIPDQSRGYLCARHTHRLRQSRCCGRSLRLALTQQQSCCSFFVCFLKRRVGARDWFDSALPPHLLSTLEYLLAKFRVLVAAEWEPEGVGEWALRKSTAWDV